MKRLLFLILLLAGLSSCSMEKRLYRPGWYTEKHHGTSAVAAQKEDALQPDPSPVVTEKQTNDTSGVTVASVPASEKTQPASVKKEEPKKKKITEAIWPPNGERPISYREARRRMEEQGCTPQPFALAIYWMAISSAILVYFGFGLLLMIATLILSIFAVNSVYESGSCVDENIAIIKAGRRIIFVTLMVMLALAIVITALVLSILYYSNGW